MLDVHSSLEPILRTHLKTHLKKPSLERICLSCGWGRGLQRHKGQSQQTRRSSIWKSGPRGTPDFKCPINIYLRKRPLGPIKRLLNLRESINTNLKSFFQWVQTKLIQNLVRPQFGPVYKFGTIMRGFAVCTICNCIHSYCTALGFVLDNHIVKLATFSQRTKARTVSCTLVQLSKIGVHCVHTSKTLDSVDSRIRRQFRIFCRKIVWERKNYHDYTVCRTIDCHFPLLLLVFLCSGIA